MNNSPMTPMIYNKFQFVEQNSVECWCDFGANLVQHFIGRYSRYSRYRTKTHDKSTISHDITRYSRYQTVFLILKEIIAYSILSHAICHTQAVCRSFARQNCPSLYGIHHYLVGAVFLSRSPFDSQNKRYN